MNGPEARNVKYWSACSAILVYFAFVPLVNGDEMQPINVKGQLVEFSFAASQTKFGDVIIESDGKRFVYRIGGNKFKEKASRKETKQWPSRIVYGFDGNEYWIAKFARLVNGRWARQDRATYVARYDSIEALTQDLPDEVVNAFGGYKTSQMLINRIAIFEDIKNLLGLDSAGLTRDVFMKSTKRSGIARVVGSNRERSVAAAPPFLKPNHTYVEISVAKKQGHVWDYMVELDDQPNFAMSRVFATITGRLANGTGGHQPWSPMPRRFECRRRGVEVFNSVVFHPQSYSDSDTTVLTFQRKQKQESKR